MRRFLRRLLGVDPNIREIVNTLRLVDGLISAGHVDKAQAQVRLLIITHRPVR